MDNDGAKNVNGGSDGGNNDGEDSIIRSGSEDEHDGNCNCE